VGHFLRTVLRVHGPNFTKLGQNIERLWVSYQFVSELRFLAAFSNAGASNLSDVENDAKFRTFRPLVKIRLGIGESYTYDRTYNTHLMAVLCAPTEYRVTTKKERKKEESAAVKLKAVATNVRLPN